MSKRETPPNPFGEATVVQSRTSTPPPVPSEHQSEAGGGEKTAVHARSNLKETFDARTVVMPSNSLPKEMPPVPKSEAPKIPDAPKVVAVQKPAPTAKPAEKKVETPVASFAVNSGTTNSGTSPAIEKTGGAIQIKVAEAEENPKKSNKEKVPREPRKPLDQKQKLMIAGGVAVAALALIFVTTGGESPSNDQQTQASQTQGEESMASQDGLESGAPKFQQLSGPPPTTTTDVLNRFDKAAQRAQEKAETYSRSGGGF